MSPTSRRGSEGSAGRGGVSSWPRIGASVPSAAARAATLPPPAPSPPLLNAPMHVTVTAADDVHELLLHTGIVAFRDEGAGATARMRSASAEGDRALRVAAATHQVETPPRAAIRLLGDISVHEFLDSREAGKWITDLAELRSGRVPRDRSGYAAYIGEAVEKVTVIEESTTSREGLAAAPTASTNSGSTSGSGSGGGGGAAEGSTSARCKKAALVVLLQYLFRGIPGVATNTGSLLVCNSNAYGAQILGRGSRLLRGSITVGAERPIWPPVVAVGYDSAPPGAAAAAAAAAPSTSRHRHYVNDASRDRDSCFTHCFHIEDGHAHNTNLIAASKSNAEKAEAVGNFVKKMLVDLSGGGSTATVTGDGQRQRREATQVVYVLVGGSAAECQSELLHAVKQQWPIFILEGSTGYAEHLAAVIRRIAQVYAHPSMDDYRALLGSGDAATADILINGKLHLVASGTTAEEFASMIDVAMRDNETLRLAWMNYATWSSNAEHNQRLTQFFQTMILILNIAATALSIAMTFIQLQFPDQSVRNVSGRQSGISVLYTTGNLLLIALPILSSLLQAIFIQLNPGGKWACLRRSSELILREIYMYRTATRKYSQVEIARSQALLRKFAGSGADSSAHGDNGSNFRSSELGSVASARKGGGGLEGDTDSETGSGGDGEKDGKVSGPRALSSGAFATRVGAGDAYRATERGDAGADEQKSEFAADGDNDDDDDAAGGRDGGGKDGDGAILDSWGDTEPYYSRSDLLYRRIEALTQEILDNLNNTAMSDYVGPLPPDNICASGDDGFSDLIPSRYVDIRLASAKAYYEASAARYGRLAGWMNKAVYGIGAAGTLLAAVALYGELKEYNLQAWVALTTGIQNAFARYIDYSRIEFFHKENTRAHAMLTNVDTWWAQLQQPGMQTDSQANRNLLVAKVETQITREVEESSAQMRTMVERLKKAQEEQIQETEEIKSQLLEGKELDKMRAVRELGIEALNPRAIAAAIADPSGPQAREVQVALLRLNEQIDAKPVLEAAIGEKHVRLLEERRERLKKLGSDALDAHGRLKDGNLGGLVMAELLPLDLLDLLKEPQLVGKLFARLSRLRLGHISRGTFLQLAAGAKKEFADKVTELPHRQMLTLARLLLLKRMISDFEGALSSINVCLYDLVTERSEAEELIGELQTITKLSWKTLDFTSICSVVKDRTLRSNIEALGEAQVRAILRRATRFFVESSVTRMLDSIMTEVAQLDIEEVFADPTDFAQRAMLRETARRKLSVHRLELLSREQLFQFLPAKLRANEDITNKSSVQLAKYVRHIAFGSFASQCADAVQALFDARQHPQDGGPDRLHVLLRSVEDRERLFRCIIEVELPEVYQKQKDVIIRELSVSPSFTAAIGAELREVPEAVLQDYVAMVQSVVSRSLIVQLFEEIADAVSSFDLRVLLPTMELRVVLMNRVENFRHLLSPGGEVEAAEILRCCAFPPLVKCFLGLGAEQLKELVKALLVRTANSFYLHAIRRCLVGAEVVDAQRISTWTAFECHRVVHALRCCGGGGTVAIATAAPDRFRGFSGSLKEIGLADSVAHELLSDLSPEAIKQLCAAVRGSRIGDAVTSLFVADVCKLIDGSIPFANPSRLLLDGGAQHLLVGLASALVATTDDVDSATLAEPMAELAALFGEGGAARACARTVLDVARQLLAVMAPVYLFRATADACAAFDVRGTFAKVGDAVQLLFALLATALRRIDVAAERAAEDETWEVVDVIRELQLMCSRGRARDEVMECLDGLDAELGLGSFFDELMLELRTVQSGHVENFVRVLLQVCVGVGGPGATAAPAATFLEFVADKVSELLDSAAARAAEISAAQRAHVGPQRLAAAATDKPNLITHGLFMWVAAIHMLDACARDKRAVRSAFCGFDPSLFLGCSEEERVSTLQRFIPDTGVVAHLVRMQVNETKALFEVASASREIGIDVSVTLVIGDGADYDDDDDDVAAAAEHAGGGAHRGNMRFSVDSAVAGR